MAKKLPSTFLNMIVVLTVISLISALALSFTYQKTKDVIAEAQRQKEENAIFSVFTAFPSDLDTKKHGKKVIEFEKKDVGSQKIKYLKWDNVSDNYKIVLVIPPDEKKKSELEQISVREIKKDNKLLGYAVKTYSDKGYADRIWMMVGFSPKGQIINTVVLDSKETPGLGTKLATEKFRSQFVGRDLGVKALAVSKDSGDPTDIDGITGATISSRAFCDAVKKAYVSLGLQTKEKSIELKKGE